jgi:hypothetical protein
MLINIPVNSTKTPSITQYGIIARSKPTIPVYMVSETAYINGIIFPSMAMRNIIPSMAAVFIVIDICHPLFLLVESFTT